MELEEESLRSQIGLGWGLGGVALAMTIGFMIVDSSLMDNNFRSLRADPGTSIEWLVYVFAVFPLMPVYVNLVHGVRPRLLRWLGVAVAGLELVFFLLHHLSHWQLGERPTVSSHVFDVVLEIVLVWVLVNSIKWAKFRRREAA